MTRARTIVCKLDELGDPDCRGLALTIDDRWYEAFIVRRGQQVFAYMNACPHTGGPLDWVPHQFLDIDKTHIQCATHAARFSIDDGRCIAGPCQGDRLTAIPVLIEAGEVVIDHYDFPVDSA